MNVLPRFYKTQRRSLKREKKIRKEPVNVFLIFAATVHIKEAPNKSRQYINIIQYIYLKGEAMKKKKKRRETQN